MSGSRWRRAVFQVHLCIGLVAGLYVVLVCVTGAALVFRLEAQRALFPHLFTPKTEGALVAPSVVFDRVARAYPDFRVSGVDAPTTSRPTYLAYVTRGSQFVTLLIDPVSAEMLGELPEQSVIRTLQELHFNLLGGRTGRTINGLGALCILALCASGVLVWWPRGGHWRRALTIDVRQDWTQLTRRLHGLIGILVVVPLAAWAVTGLSFTFPQQFRSAISAVSPLTVRRAPVSSTTSAGPVLSVVEIVEQARRRAPGQYVARVIAPATERAPFQVWFSERSPTPTGVDLPSMDLDSRSGELLADTRLAPPSAGDAILAWMVPLHVGMLAGTTVKLLWFGLGLVPPFLFMTGLVMWWRRVARRRLAGVLS